MGKELKPLGAKAFLSCRQTRCGDCYWLADSTKIKARSIISIHPLKSLHVTDLREGDYIELTISGSACGTFLYYVHPDMQVANQPVELQSQTWRRTDSLADTYQAIHGVAMFTALKDVNANTVTKEIVFTWYLEGNGMAVACYTLTARVMR